MTSLNALSFLKASSSPDLSFVSRVTYIKMSCSNVRIHFGTMQGCNVPENGLFDRSLQFNH